jgi:hypothetical protein
VDGTVLAAVPVNSEAGSYLTFAFPVLLFCVIGAALYILLFGRPHARVPARRIVPAADAGPPSPEAAHAAAVAGGLPTAVGGGSAESGIEPAGAVSAAVAEGVAASETAAGGARGGPGEDSGPGADGKPEEGSGPGAGSGPEEGGA